MLPKNYTTLLAKDNVLSLFLYPKRAFDYDFRVIHLRLLRFCLTTFGLWEATYLHSQASPHLPTEKMDRKQRKNLYYKTRANKKGVSCRKRHKTPKKIICSFSFLGTLRALARGVSLPSFLCVCFVWFICQIQGSPLQIPLNLAVHRYFAYDKNCGSIFPEVCERSERTSFPKRVKKGTRRSQARGGSSKQAQSLRMMIKRLLSFLPYSI